MLSQHIGAVCNATVKKRDTVEAGDVIGDSEAFVSAKVHTPLPGTIKDVTLKSHPVLGREIAIVIDVDQETATSKTDCRELFNNEFDDAQYSEDKIVNAIKTAGIVGMGGAGFPASVKIAANPNMPKETMIVNACECEPYITCDYRMMLEWTHQFVAGVMLIKKASGCKEAFIGIEDNKPLAINVVHETLLGMKCKNIKVVPLKTKYPQGGERQLIQAVTKKTVPTGKIPPMLGLLVTNVATCCAVAEAVVTGNPLTHRAVTVTGHGIKNPGNFYVPIGTSVGEMIEFCGGLTKDCVKVVMGGPMMGFSVADLTTPLTKTSGSILCLTKKEIGKAKFNHTQTACLRCGRCLDVCPEGLNPTKIAHAVKAQRLDIAMNYHMTACIECGCCSYVCPANIEITGYIKTGKILNARMQKRMPQ